MKFKGLIEKMSDCGPQKLKMITLPLVDNHDEAHPVLVPLQFDHLVEFVWAIEQRWQSNSQSETAIQDLASCVAVNNYNAIPIFSKFFVNDSLTVG